MNPTIPYEFGIFRSKSPEKVTLVASMSIEGVEHIKRDPNRIDKKKYDNNHPNSMFEMQVPEWIKGIQQGSCYANRLHMKLFTLARPASFRQEEYEQIINDIKTLIREGINVQFPVLSKDFSKLKSPLEIAEETKWPAQVIKILNSSALDL